MRGLRVFAIVMPLAIASIFGLAQLNQHDANSAVGQTASIDTVAIHLTARIAELPVLVIEDIN